MNVFLAVTAVLTVMSLGGGCSGRDVRSSVIHVSPAGSDANPGTADRPLRTPAAARDALRRLRASGAWRPAETGVIEFADGEYRFDGPLRLGPEDGSNVIWRAAHRGQAVFTAATALEWRPLADSAVRALLPETARDKVRVAAIPGTGALPTFFGGSHVSAQHRADLDIPIGLFAGDERLCCAREPNDGFLKTVAEGEKDAKKALTGSIAVSYPRLADLAKEPFAWSFGLWGVEWAELNAPVLGADAERKTLKIDPTDIRFGFKKDKPYFLFNVFYGLDRPGEWVVDRARRLIYLWPKDGAVADAVLTEGILRLEGASDLTLDGLVFEKVRKTAVGVKDCERVSLVATTVRHTGSWAVRVEGGRDCRVVGCDLYDLGEGGVWLEGGDHKSLTPSGHVVDNCHIHHFGEVFYNYKPGVMLRGVGCRVTHNLIHHTNHSAVIGKGNDHYIGYNVIHDACLSNDDAGSVYFCQVSWVMRGGTIEHNVIHYAGKPDMFAQTHGVYLDDYTSGMTVRDNLINRAANGVYLGGGQDNVVVDNVILNTWKPVVIGTRYGWGQAAKGRKSILYHDIVSDPQTYTSPLWASRYPGLQETINAADPVFAHHALRNVVTGNVSVVSGPFDHQQWESIAKLTTWSGNVERSADPGFANYKALDWMAKPGSEFADKISACRFGEAGLYASAERLSPPVKFGAGVTTPDWKGFFEPYYPSAIRLDFALQGKLPAGWSEFSKKNAFAEACSGCKVPGWASGKRVEARFDPPAENPGQWRDYRCSFTPRFDAWFRIEAMGGSAKVEYKDICVEGVKPFKTLFANPQPFAATHDRRQCSNSLKGTKGVPVVVTWKARMKDSE